MILFDKILTSLIGTVGWRQSTVSGDVVITAENQASSSGLYVQGGHPAVTVKNIKATQEDKAISDANMNVVLTNLVKDGAANVLNYVFPVNQSFENDLLYRNESDFSQTLQTRKGFVGFEICVSNRRDVVSILNKVILQFNGSGNVKLLLFNSGQSLAISTKTIAVTADTNITSVLDWVMGYIIAPGGKYYIGYLNTDMTIYAYNRVFSSASYMTPFNSVIFKPIHVDGWNTETLFDIRNITYVSESFGLNFDVTTALDYSNVILQNKDSFAKAIQLSAACEALALMTTSTRINLEERMIMSAFGQKVLIDSQATYNLYATLDKELKMLKSRFETQIQSGTLR